MSDPLAASNRPLLDPEEWVRQQEERAERLRADGERAKAELAAVQVERTDRDHVVTVTVNTSGVLMSVVFSPRAENQTPSQLSAKLMQTYGEATREASAKMLGIMSDLMGGDTDAMEFLKSVVPEQDEEPDDGYRHQDGAGYQGWNGGYRR